VTERRAFVAALKQLMAWHVLTEDEGSVESYAGDDDADALLTIDRELARHLVSGPVSQSATPADLIEKAADPGEAGPRHKVRRLLVEAPVVYVDDLTEEERDWLRRSQRREQRILEDFTGLQAEIRAEGVALIDPEQDLTDTQFPGTGTVAWAALLLLGRLVAELTPASGAAGTAITEGRIEEHLRVLAEEHGKAWSKELTSAPALLNEAVLDLLHRMCLIRPTRSPQAGWLLTAAAARYQPEVTQ
jgi:uncharacterized protein (TIGR02678 family)